MSNDNIASYRLTEKEIADLFDDITTSNCEGGSEGWEG